MLQFQEVSQNKYNNFLLNWQYTTNFISLKVLTFKKYLKKLDINIDAIKKSFGNNLKDIRIAKKMTQVTLGVKCGLDDSQISKLERGVWDIQLSTIVILAKGLGVEPKELLDFKI